MSDETTKTFDLTPSWRALMPALVELARSDNIETRRIAWAELNKLADAADRLNRKGAPEPPKGVTVDPHRLFVVEGEALTALKIAATRLYSENRMNGDEMRDMAHTLTSVYDTAIPYEEPKA